MLGLCTEKQINVAIGAPEDDVRAHTLLSQMGFSQEIAERDAEKNRQNIEELQREVFGNDRTTYYVRISDVSGQVTKVLSLQKISGVKFEPSNVTLETHAEVKVETTTEVPIRTINVPEGMVMRTFPPRVTVSYVVMESMAKSITEDDFSVVVDYNDLDTSIEQQSLPLRLMKAPNMAKRVKLPFTNVDYLLESN